MSYRYFEMKCIEWGEARRIVHNSTALAQLKKTREEVDELEEALLLGDKAARDDAFGDILVTLIMAAAIEDTDLVVCLEKAYNEIKDRKGYLTPEGIFVKEGQ
jgi:NTP pyrophosphatase (non-canonical NTP hydrolase)